MRSKELRWIQVRKQSSPYAFWPRWRWVGTVQVGGLTGTCRRRPWPNPSRHLRAVRRSRQQTPDTSE